MAKKCRGCDNPQTQNEGIECDGNFIDDSCVVLTDINEYLSLPIGTKLSLFIKKITLALKQTNILLNRKIDYTNLPTYNDNNDAINGGLTINKPYKTPNGDVKVVV